MCDSRCTSAESPRSACQCECGGANHGGGSGGAGRSGRNRGRRVRTNIVENVVTGIVRDATISAVSTVVPQVGMIYAGYKAVNFGYKLYRHMENNENREVLSEITKYVISNNAEKISEPKAQEIASGITMLAQNSGLIEELSNNTGIDSSVYSSMLEGTVKTAITSSGENLTEYIVSTIVDG